MVSWGDVYSDERKQERVIAVRRAGSEGVFLITRWDREFRPGMEVMFI